MCGNDYLDDPAFVFNCMTAPQVQYVADAMAYSPGEVVAQVLSRITAFYAVVMDGGYLTESDSVQGRLRIQASYLLDGNTPRKGR